MISPFAEPARPLGSCARKRPRYDDHAVGVLDPGVTQSEHKGARSTMSERQGRRIVALVLTHNAPQALARCLAAIGAQADGPEEVLVVDNASQPPVRESLLPKSGRSLRVTRSEVNGGPAGGWAMALRLFLANDFTDAWLMDDDIVPEPKCSQTCGMQQAKLPLRPLCFRFPFSRMVRSAVGLVVWLSHLPRDCGDGGLANRGAVLVGGGPNTANGESLGQAFHVASSMGPWCITTPSASEGTSRLGSTTTSPAIRCTTTFTSCTGWVVIRRRSPAWSLGQFCARRDRIGCIRAICRGLYDGACGRLGIRYQVSPLHERDLSPAAPHAVH